MDPYQGFEDFVRDRTGALSRSAYLLTADHHLAEDLLQIALSRVAARWVRLRDGNPDAYVRRVMVNELTSWRRRRKYHERPAGDVLPDEAEAGSTDLASSVIRRVVVIRALARLAPGHRAVLVLRFYEDMSEADVASILRCAVGTVKSRTHSALARLRVVAPELAELFDNAAEVTR